MLSKQPDLIKDLYFNSVIHLFLLNKPKYYDASNAPINSNF